MPPERDGNPTTRLLAKLVYDLVKTEHFESLADLTAALKARCGRLRIRWTNDEIDDALRRVGAHTPLVHTAGQPSPAVIDAYEHGPR